MCSESNINRLKNRLEACITKPVASIDPIVVGTFEDLGIMLTTLPSLPLSPSSAAVLVMLFWHCSNGSASLGDN